MRAADYARTCPEPELQADLTRSVMEHWRQGHDTLAIAEILFRPNGEDLEWFEALVAVVLHSDQDRRHGDKTGRAG